MFEAGWSEEALFDAISVCAVFNMMNRIVEGTGVVSSVENMQSSRERHEFNKDNATPYTDFGRMMGLEPKK